MNCAPEEGAAWVCADYTYRWMLRSAASIDAYA